MAEKNKVVSIDKDKLDQLMKVQKEQANKKNDWTDHFVLKVNSNGESEGIKSTVKKNVLLILNNDPNLKDLFKYNEFTGNVDISRNVTIDLKKWGGGVIKFHKGALKDIDSNNLGIYFESLPKYHTTFKTQLINDALDASARQHSYNPLVDYFEDAYKNWDKKRRVDDFLPIYLGSEKDETNTMIIRLWLMGAVAKAYNPYTKFDFVLDLVGGQGAGKTSLLQKLAPLGLYTDQFSSFTDTDDYEVMKNALIVNDDEMTASNRASFEEIKKFITMQYFDYRKSYGRLPEKFPKKFVIARTTNEISHLKDRSGDRRFLSILVDPKRQKIHPVEGLTSDYVKQLWGEVVWLYRQAKDPFKLDQHQEELLALNREQFMSTTELEDSLTDVIENHLKDSKFISNSELAKYLYDNPLGFRSNQKDYTKVCYYMEHMGYKTRVQQRLPNGKHVRGFRKID